MRTRQSGHLVIWLRALAFVWLIDAAARHVGGPLGWFCDRPAVQYLGRISYGLYVLHLLVAGATWWGLGRLGWAEPSPAVLFLPLVGATILLASLSWRLIERSFNELKQRFDERRVARAA